MHQREIRLEGAVEVQRVHTVDAVELGAPLHCSRPQIPEPTPDMRQRFALHHASVHLSQGRLGQVLLGDIPDDDNGSNSGAALVEDGAKRERDGLGHAVGTEDFGFKVPDPISSQGRRDDDLHFLAQVVRKEDVNGPSVTSSAERPKSLSAP